MSETLIIGKREFAVFDKELPNSSLNFYPQNPRVYSILNISGDEPTQEEIDEQLCNMDHVKQLRLSIEANGGLIDPLIVRDGDFVVLEGNSRLAAYRILAKKNPVKWSKVKCTLLPNDITDDAIFTLLGQYHIIGRKDWNPFEQAGYIFRRVKSSSISTDDLADELGLKRAEAKSLIEIYSFMIEKDDVLPQHWSYYVEYLKSRSIRKYREIKPELDEIVVNQIKTNRIRSAIDIREKLEPITKIPEKKANKIFEKFIKEEKSLYECFDEAESTGKTSNMYQYLYKFRTKIKDGTTQKSIINVSRDKKPEYIFELKAIKKTIEKLLETMDTAE